MSIVLDSLRPTDACIARPSSNDSCEVEATFHTVTLSTGNTAQVQQMWEQDRIFIRRILRGQQVQFVLDDPRTSVSVRPILRDHHFDLDLARPDLQASLDRSGILVNYMRGRVQDYRRDHPDLPDAMARFMEGIADFALVGNITDPDPLQRERNQQMLRQLAELPNDLHRHVRMNILMILASESNDPNQTNRSRWSAAMNSRFDRLLDVSNLSERFRQQTLRLDSNTALAERLRSFLGQVVGYLFGGSPSLDELTRSLRPLAEVVYRTPLPPGSSAAPTDRYNLYQIIGLVLEPLRQRSSFRGEGSSRDRLERLTHWVQLPQQTEDLEFSVLEPSQALEQSLYRQISSPSTLQALLRGVNDVIGLPFLSSDGLRSNGYLREIVHVIAASLRVEGNGSAAVAHVDLARLQNQIQSLSSTHVRDRREVVSGALAVLRFLFGAQVDRPGIRVFWNGSFHEFPFSADLDRREFRQLYQTLIRQVRGSLDLTERVLPATEGVLCALGVAGTVADSVRMGLSGGSDPLDNIFLGASGFITGLGCLPLLGRAVAGVPRNAWIRDGLLGGAGALGLGTAGALLPFAFRLGMPPRPTDGRGPSMGFGP